MPNTITTFHTFVQNTKARATEVNTNFSNYRGTLLPINTDTASASDLSHDIGSDEHRWNIGYFGSVDLETSTTTASLVIQGQTSNTTGAFEFLIEGATAAVIDTNGINPASSFSLNYASTAPGTIQIFGSTTSGIFFTTAVSIPFTNTYGNLVEIVWNSNYNDTLSTLGIVANTTTSSRSFNFRIYRDTTTNMIANVSECGLNGLGSASKFETGGLRFVDMNPTVGSSTYYLQVALYTNQTFRALQTRVSVYETLYSPV